MSSEARTELVDYCVRALLRCFRRDRDHLAVSQPRLSASDAQVLRLHWALSDWVGALAERTATNPREAQHILDDEELLVYGSITGAVDARGTLLLQERTQDAGSYVVREPMPTLNSGPNHLIVYTVREALAVLQWATRRLRATVWKEAIGARIRLLERALRVLAARDAGLAAVATQRPSMHAVRAASKSRVPIYRLALEAFQALQGVERRDSVTLKALFSRTLMSKLEDWQQFEIATALAAAEAIATAIRTPLLLNLSLDDAPFAAVGSFEIKMQCPQPPRAMADLDASERLVRTMTDFIGLEAGTGRADVAVFQWSGGTKRLVALFECKWFNSDASRSSAIQDACEQLARYSRDAFTAPSDTDALLRESFVAIASRGGIPDRIDGAGPVGLIDFAGLRDGGLTMWAQRLLGSAAVAA